MPLSPQALSLLQQASPDLRARVREGLNAALQTGKLTGEQIARTSAALQSLAQADQPVERFAAPVTPQRGFFGELGEISKGLIQMPGAIVEATTPRTTAESFMSPGALAIKNMFVEPSVEAGGRAIEAARAGRTGEAIEQTARAIPVAGPVLAPLGEAIGRGDLGAAGARTLELALAPKLARTSVGAVQSAGRLAQSVASPKSFMARITQELMNRGTAYARLEAFLQDRAMQTQQHISEVASRYKTRVGQMFEKIGTRVDKAKPEGIVPRAVLSEKVTETLGDIVKVPETIPGSLKKMMATPEAGLGGIAPGKIVGGVTLRETPSLRQLREAEAAAAASRKGPAVPVSPGPNYSFTELQQIRSDLGSEIAHFRGPGPVRAAMSAVYKNLTEIMRRASKESRVEKAWTRANAMWRTYIDDFERGPVADMLTGKNAEEILGVMRGKTYQQVRDTLGKYVRGYKLDPNLVWRAGREFDLGEKFGRLGEITRFEIIMAPLTKGFSFAKIAPGRIGQAPEILTEISKPGATELRMAAERAPTRPEMPALRGMLSRRKAERPLP